MENRIILFELIISSVIFVKWQHFYYHHELLRVFHFPGYFTCLTQLRLKYAWMNKMILCYILFNYTKSINVVPFQTESHPIVVVTVLIVYNQNITALVFVITQLVCLSLPTHMSVNLSTRKHFYRYIYLHFNCSTNCYCT